ncbi:hypothetical protein BFP72_15665 [Reichenbachiella sp. 5M10]|nr:hypothetical protein [Reichenbachiella sp. 5M10]PIB36735.1 hypothetical protein BFP72_15665 [Reichenbachiella sp. 5M10]
MLEYSKTILSKVSFDRSLFEKELTKAIASVGEHIEKLRSWCYEKFGHLYPKILDKHFKLSH